MINLIPPEGHRALKREYYYRVIATAGFLFGAVFLLLTAAYVPAYIFVNAQINILKTESEQGGALDETYKKAESEVTQTQEVLSQLKAQKTGMFGSDAINEVERHVPQGVTLRSFSVDQVKGQIVRVNIQGTAPTREILAQFKNAINLSEMFSSAEVPIADLARDSNLPFSMTITIDPSTL